MKKVSIMFMLLFAVFVVASCDQDDSLSDNWTGQEQKTLAVKRRTLQSEQFGSSNAQRIDPSVVGENECALWALTMASRRVWDEKIITATQYYNDLRTYAADKYDYEPGTAMSSSMMLDIAKDKGIASSDVFFEADSINAPEYFQENSNRIKTISIENHTGVFVSYSRKDNMVKYRDNEGLHVIPVDDVVSVLVK